MDIKTSQITIMIFTLIFNSCSNLKSDNIKKIEYLSKIFEEDYRNLELPELEIGYVTNLKNIKSLDSILIQERFFKSIDNKLKEIDYKNISENKKLDLELIKYETTLNLERITLEKKWKKLEIDSFSEAGLSHIPYGKEWYVYFLKKWIDLNVSPKEIYEFGLQEINKIKSRMKILQEQSGLDSLSFNKHINNENFLYKNVNDIQAAFEAIKKRVERKVKDYFPYISKTPEVKIARGTNKDLAQVPAFYMNTDSTFYYNYFDKPYNKRQIGWIYIHEAIPGHHYQYSLDKIVVKSSIQKLFSYYGFIEGYAAYVEELGYQIGAYQDIYDELGKLEWDIIRSVRVAMDVGINYYDWSDDKALKFWQQHIKNKDDIAFREIARMKRWPAQVVTYKYGANKILELKSKEEENQNFSSKEFHKRILKYGSLPLSILEKMYQTS